MTENYFDQQLRTIRGRVDREHIPIFQYLTLVLTKHVGVFGNNGITPDTVLKYYEFINTYPDNNQLHQWHQDHETTPGFVPLLESAKLLLDHPYVTFEQILVLIDRLSDYYNIELYMQLTPEQRKDHEKEHQLNQAIWKTLLFLLPTN